MMRNFPTRLKLAAALSIAVLVSACGQPPAAPVTGQAPAAPQAEAAPQQGGDPNRLCKVNFWMAELVAFACEPGQKVAFLPDRWGNDQLPLLFIAGNCDLRHPVAYNNGGVVCIYHPNTPEPEAVQEDAEDSESAGEGRGGVAPG